MEFLLVCKTKLKIILDREEVERYRLADFTSEQSVELRQRLAEILNEAEERVGFHTEGERLLVSYYPTRLAGAELFVTMVSDRTEESRFYIFPTLGEICRAAAATDYRGDSRAYLLPDGEYCLELLSDGDDILSEFVDATPAHKIAPLLKYAKKLTDTGAIDLFAALR